jgi:MFS family permease
VLLNVAQVCGQLGMGFIADRTTPFIPMGISSLVGGVAALTFWGMGKTLAPLAVFAVLEGLFAGGYGVLYCRFVTCLTDDRATGLWLYSLFDFQRGVGSIVGGLVAGSLTKQAVDRGYGAGKYEDLILVIGGSLLISSIGGLGWLFKTQNKEDLVVSQV